MYGQHINQLNVYLKSKGVLGSPVWTKQGTHGDMWRKGEVSLIGATPFQVIHSAVLLQNIGRRLLSFFLGCMFTSTIY